MPSSDAAAPPEPSSDAAAPPEASSDAAAPPDPSSDAAAPPPTPPPPPPPSKHESGEANGSFASCSQASADTIAKSFLMYPRSALAQLGEMKDKVPEWLHKVLPELASRFAMQEAAVKVNRALLQQILADMGILGIDDPPPAAVVNAESFDQLEDSWVTGAIAQLKREWTDEGAAERAQSIDLTLEALERYVPPPASDASTKPSVIVPGAGLGRHVWELAMRGYDALGVECAMMMIVISRWVVEKLIPRGEGRPVCPHIHELFGPSNVQRAGHLGREFSVPGESALERARAVPPGTPLPGTVATAGMRVRSGDFAELGDDPSFAGHWDAVVTCFYLDACGAIMHAIDTTKKLRARPSVESHSSPTLSASPHRPTANRARPPCVPPRSQGRWRVDQLRSAGVRRHERWAQQPADAAVRRRAAAHHRARGLRAPRDAHDPVQLHVGRGVHVASRLPEHLLRRAQAVTGEHD